MELFNRVWNFGWTQRGKYVLRVWLIDFNYWRNVVWQVRFFGFYLTSTSISSILYYRTRKMMDELVKEQK